jgi:hypothetical protein
MLAVLAQHAARIAPTAKAGSPLTSVKAYRVVHRLPTPRELTEDIDPRDETLFLAYFMGDYDPELLLAGELTRANRSVEVRYDDTGQVVHKARDPYLYWLIPISYDEPTEPFEADRPFGEEPRKTPPWKRRVPIVNYVRLHAGDKDGRHSGW